MRLMHTKHEDGSGNCVRSWNKKIVLTQLRMSYKHQTIGYIKAVRCSGVERRNVSERQVIIAYTLFNYRMNIIWLSEIDPKFEPSAIIVCSLDKNCLLAVKHCSISNKLMSKGDADVQTSTTAPTVWNPVNGHLANVAVQKKNCSGSWNYFLSVWLFFLFNFFFIKSFFIKIFIKIYKLFLQKYSSIILFLLKFYFFYFSYYRKKAYLKC